ncbi:transposable element Tcb2 transposase [Trichonephila clavata]|uniref:Transposable element Tcb2 transposase n=1 Tax=Trichonephila clavata TaxID=2740835 RepID=A0A8X6GAR9_TRICU|nr:transposable element Tcb2 transposase [Trichonephila clavata]
MFIVHFDGLGEFQQDYATPHVSRIATEDIQKYSSEFRHFLWPPKSPDMNIIEYIWDALQRAIPKRSPPPLTPTDLWIALKEFMVSSTSSTTSDINRIHATPCCGLLGKLHDNRQVYQFFGSSVYIVI